jgi:hypothetical protein
LQATMTSAASACSSTPRPLLTLQT